MTKKLFDDGSSVEWVDKETLNYSEHGFSVLVRVDFFRESFFKYGRVIKASSIIEWNVYPESASKIIDESKRVEIIDKLKAYYKDLNIKCRVEP